MTAAPRWLPWSLAAVLLMGATSTSKVVEQRVQPLRAPLHSALPSEVERLLGADVTVSPAELEVAGVSDYVMRVYRPIDQAATPLPWVSVYVGFYESQTRGRTIHSPKNCMPGAGWEALEARTTTLALAGGGEVDVNRYLLVNEEQRVLVLYWYQGRGRVVASEYVAKWELLRDAALHRRSDEALVRIVVPIVEGEEQAFKVANELARSLLPRLAQALPAA